MTESVYDRLGARPAINGLGVYTDLGGAMLSPSTWAAMAEADAAAVRMPELLDATGQRVARLLGVEDARVTSGASPAIALAAAAVMAGTDGESSQRLPDTSGLKSEVVVQRAQLTSYKYLRMVWMTGAKVISIGDDHGASIEQLEAAISGRTAAVFVVAHHDKLPGVVKLADGARVAHQHSVPVIADAAFLNYPPATMRQFTDAGADLVIFSAKYFYGPNCGGIIAGRSDLIAAVRANDFTGYESGRWLVFGRPFKLDRFSVVGTVVALEEWFAMDHSARWAKYAEMVDELARAVEAVPGITTRPAFFTMEETLESDPVNCLVISVGSGSPRRAGDVRDALEQGNPRVLVHCVGNDLVVAVDAMEPRHLPIVIQRLHGLLSAGDVSRGEPVAF